MRKINRVLLRTIVSAAVLLAGCMPEQPAPSVPPLEFHASAAIPAAQELHVGLGVHNAGSGDIPGDARWAGHMEIRDASGEVHATAEVLGLPAIRAGQTVWLLDWHAVLAPNSYRLTWGSDAHGFTVLEFTVVERDGQLYLAQDAPIDEPTDGERLAALAVADLASSLSIDAGTIVVESITPVDFPDASLGLPEQGMVYAQVVTPGYVIRLRAAGQLYEYHAAGERVVVAPAQVGPTDWTSVEMTDAGISFQVPTDWAQQASETTWAPDSDPQQRLGFRWADLEPPAEPEAALLPSGAQILASEPVALEWAEGRRLSLEVYGPPTAGGDQAPVEAYETHVLIVLGSSAARRGLDFYVSAPTPEQLAELDLLLQHVLQTVALDTVETESEDTSAEWPVWADERFGFQLRYPPGWTYKLADARGTGMPSDWPVASVVMFFPQTWAERFEQTGAPDPNAPPAVPALSLEVCVGDEEQFRRVYVAPERSQTLTVNGIAAVREETGSGEYVTVQYVFQHPGRADVRVVLVDHFSQFAARAAESPDIVALIPAVIATFEFVR